MELIDKAREALYRLDGQIASEDGMIIENALTALEMSLEGLKWYGGNDQESIRWGLHHPCNDGGIKARSIIAKLEGSKPNKDLYREGNGE